MDNPVATSSPGRHLVKLHLENFQDHQDTTIEFKPGINLITGTSDAGKSAILRAINFLLHNQPRGKSFIHTGMDEARVTAWWSDGTMVQRLKGDRNAILLRLPTGEEQLYESFGNSLPEEVVQAMGEPPIDKLHGPISYAEQMAPLFLVHLTATELPRCISELTGIDDLEEAAKLLSTKAKQEKTKAKESGERLADHERDLEQYADLDAQIEEQDRLERRWAKLKAMQSKIEKARDLLRRYNDIMARGNRAFAARQAALVIVEHEAKLAPIQALRDQIATGRDILSRWERYQKAERAAKEALAAAERIASEELAQRLAAIQELQREIARGRELLARYNEIREREKRLTEAKANWENALAEAEAEHERVVEELLAAGLLCPQCQRPLTEDACQTSA